MSSGYEAAARPPPPPPPPPPHYQPPSPSSHGTARIQQNAVSPLRRLAVQPPTITTALAGAGSHQHGGPHGNPAQTPSSATTPYSAASSFSPASSFGSSISSPVAAQRGSPNMISAYNPQQWGRQGPVGGVYMPHGSPQTNIARTTLEMTGMEAAMPSPPPPYSPGQPQNMAQAMNAPNPAINSAISPPPPSASPGDSNAARSDYTSSSTASQQPAYEYNRTNIAPPPSSTPTNPPTFAPPPGTGRDRSASRSRPDGQRSIFSFGFRNRGNDNSPVPASAVEARQVNSDTPTRAPPPPTHPVASQQPIDLFARPPASRRAASTGAIGLPGTPSRSRSDSESGNQAWNPGMPLPPPPPGPPPSGSRSQSMSRTPDTPHSTSRPDGQIAAPAPRRPLHRATLGPVPPTPADWVDEDSAQPRHGPGRGLQLNTSIDTSGAAFGSSSRSTDPVTAHPTSVSTSGGLTRQPARREPSARGIRERRSESRAARERTSEIQTAIEQSKNPWADDLPGAEAAKPADLVLSSAHGTISRRRELGKENADAGASASASASARGPTSAATPMSGHTEGLPSGHTGGLPSGRTSGLPSGHTGGLPSGQVSSRSMKAYGDIRDTGSNRSTPRAESSRITSPDVFAPTPPFSPNGEGSSKDVHGRSISINLPPKALPTPPIRRQSDESNGFLSPSSFGQDRPISHILHAPYDENSMQAPLSPVRPPSSASARPSSSASARPPSSASAAHRSRPSEGDGFAQACVERHRRFIEREMSATSDQARLELFTEFIVAESRLRRDRYSAAFDTMASEIFDLTRDMWRSYNASGRRPTTPSVAGTTPSATPSNANFRTQYVTTDGSNDLLVQTPSSVSSNNPHFTPRTEPDSPASVSSQPRSRGDIPHRGNFQPCLSPIPSMAMSTVPDEEDSRGRTASRWWEASADGSQGRGGRKLERTKRESKYMGVHRDAYENLQWEVQASPAASSTPGPSGNYAQYGPNEYPPEKVGSQEQLYHQPASAQSNHFFLHSAPTTPDPFKLDVSRLVTLPPPYPRHYPAVNNNHPHLAELRSTHRAMSDFAEAAAIKERFAEKLKSKVDQARAEVEQRRQRLRLEIQEQIRTGAMSFAEAAAKEAAFDQGEGAAESDEAKAAFDAFKRDVYSPLQTLFSDRLARTAAAMEQLRNDLFAHSPDSSNATEPQEEGDEQPELLEKLTLLKWLFETRETLHRELCALEDSRADRYREVVLAPYRAARNDAKRAEAEGFFAADALERREMADRTALRRYEDFLAVVDASVSRGVEAQLSAFWDIAPGLLAIVQKVPGAGAHGARHPRDEEDDDEALAALPVLVPPQEVAENPSYADFPLQYLYTLLQHAEKSAFQFIESQTNLLCLLHGARSAAMGAHSALLATERARAGEKMEEVEAEMGEVRRHEEGRLTGDLKEKVGVVERQWSEGLGDAIKGCRVRVEECLRRRGGWDENLEG